MEFQKFLKLFRINTKLIVFSSFLGLLISSFAYYFLPVSYLAEGTLYAFPISNAKQNSEVSNELNYARNIIAISNSPEFKTILQNKKLVDISFVPLVGISSGIKLKEVSPNILTLAVSSSNYEETLHKYQTYYLSLKDFANLLNQGNSNFELKTLKESPTISSTSKNLFLFLMIGFICGNFMIITYLYLKKK